MRTAAVFALPERLSHKADPAAIAADELHLAAVGETLDRTVADLTERLAQARRAPARGGQAALDRDQEVHRLTARLRTLRRFGLDLCLGRMVPAAGRSGDGSDDGAEGGAEGQPAAEPLYVGRLGLEDAAGRRLLVDWRSPVAEPFFGATHANPMGLVSRRRFRWTAGRITDYWDEVFTPEGLVGQAALDDQSAFVASLGASRSPRMRDVLATLQADQDAIIRAGSAGTLVVDGGPGTGKTVVALHRTAYLLYSDPRLGHRRGGVLFVGPHEPYLAYVADVLPSLGEEGVQTCTVRDLVPEGRDAVEERDPEVARLKESARLLAAIEPAVRLYEEPPTMPLEVTTPWADLWLDADDWAAAFDAPDPGVPHNEAREEVWNTLLDALVDSYDGDEATPAELRKALERNGELRAVLNRSWPLLDPAELVADLWSVPAYLRRCAPWLTPDEVKALHRKDSGAWTTADLPFLDAARRRLGDRESGRRARRREVALAAQRQEMDRVVDHLVESDDSEMRVMSMLRGADLQRTLVDEAGLEAADADPLAGPFAHVVVDEAQELTDAQWQMLRSRCPSGSLTVVGDRAQARHGFTESWADRLERVGLIRVTVATLGINYRTPAEVMAEAEPVIRAVLPDANVPTSVRSTGLPVLHAAAGERDRILAEWLDAHAEGTACVIGDPTFSVASLADAPLSGASRAAVDRVRSLTPELAKGLEFDLVVLVDPQRFGDGPAGGIERAVDRYVAMTRATQQLVILTSAPFESSPDRAAEIVLGVRA